MSITNKKAILVIPRHRYRELEEAITLTKTVGYEVEQIIKVRNINPKYYIGIHILKELKEAVNNDDNVIVIYDTTRPRHIINLMRELKCEVIDRVELILNIFALHAGSMEAKLQIELAKLKHQLPLIREAIRQAKLKELPGFLGPGRYAIDAYYRMLRSREARIRRKLEELRKRRRKLIASRRTIGMPHASIVGYTCAGKTTLFNVLVGEAKPIGPEPFTTLSPKSKLLKYKNEKIILIDTVGFIQDIPIEIIEAFYATLDVVVASDIVVLVIDVSDEEYDVKLKASIDILRRIGVIGKPLIIVANKIDLLDEIEAKYRAKNLYEKAREIYEPVIKSIPTSALHGYNLDELRETLCQTARNIVKVTT